MAFMKEFVVAGFFCRKCYTIIDGEFSGKTRFCPNCLKTKLKITKDKKIKI
jgi:Zn finger protein HypA/HybF involved in hydrogenase expression